MIKITRFNYNRTGRIYMKMITEEVIEKNGYRIHLIPTKKYKTISIVAKFQGKIERENITKRALLPFILRKGTKSYNTEVAFQEKLDELYGATLSIDGTKKGNHHILSFRLNIANDKFIGTENSILEEAVSLLHEVIYAPNTADGAFIDKIVAREKEALKQRLISIQDDKMAYANQRLIDEMCKGENFSIHASGYEEDLTEINSTNLYAYYKSILNEPLDIFVVGDLNKAEMVEMIDRHFPSQSETKSVRNITETEKQIESTQEIIEKQTIQQAKLHIGYRTNITYKSAEYFALQVFNGIFGGFPSSKLFINVREKNSLAYYAASRIESHQGLLFIVSGIAPTDYKKAREIIELQMTAMKNGEFTEEDLAETKEQLKNQILETLDHAQGIIEMFYQQITGERKLTPDEFIKGIESVTYDEVVLVAEKMIEDTVYLLTDKGEVNE